jgi:Predicted membrane protein
MYEAAEIKSHIAELELLLGQFVAQTGEAIRNTNKSIESLSREVKIFQEEMKEFKEEMKEFKDEMKEFKEEMKEFKDETRKHRDSIDAQIAQMIADRKEEARQWNKQWGELANKMGTLVEDIIAPAVRPVMQQFFNEEITYRAVNVRKYDKASGLRGEFDVIAASESYVYLVETKSTPKASDIAELAQERVSRFRELFPEFSALKLVPVLASLRFEESMHQPATEAGVFLMAYREWEYMELLNFEALKNTL